MITPEIVERVAANLGNGPFGYVWHKPEEWARVRLCFDNVIKKVNIDGGRPVWGWSFQTKMSSEFGNYMIALNHAVWCSGVGSLFDITPLHDDINNRPLYDKKNGILFKVDMTSEPFQNDRVIAPQPSRFFPLDEGQPIRDYCRRLDADERLECDRVIKSMRPS